MSCHTCGKALLQNKIEEFYYPRSEDSLQSMHMIDIFKIHSKSLKYTIERLKEAWWTSTSYDSSVGSRDGCRPLPSIYNEAILSAVAGFAFTTREYISQQLPITASVT